MMDAPEIPAGLEKLLRECEQRNADIYRDLFGSRDDQAARVEALINALAPERIMRRVKLD